MSVPHDFLQALLSQITAAVNGMNRRESVEEKLSLAHSALSMLEAVIATANEEDRQQLEDVREKLQSAAATLKDMLSTGNMIVAHQMPAHLQAVWNWFTSLPTSQRSKYGLQDSKLRSIFQAAEDDGWSDAETMEFIESHLPIYEYDAIDSATEFAMSLPGCDAKTRDRILQIRSANTSNRSEGFKGYVE